MKIGHRAAALVATAGLAVGAIAIAPSAGASNPTAAKAALGNKPIAAVLTSDGNTFDTNWGDYDIVTEAALAVRIPCCPKPRAENYSDFEVLHN